MTSSPVFHVIVDKSFVVGRNYITYVEILTVLPLRMINDNRNQYFQIIYCFAVDQLLSYRVVSRLRHKLNKIRARARVRMN